MRIFTLLLSLFVISSSTLSAVNLKQMTPRLVNQQEEQVYVFPGVTPQTPVMKSQSKAYENVMWLPGTMNVYETYNNGVDWDLSEEHTFQYKDGLLIVDETEDQRISYEYNSNGKWITKLIENVNSKGNWVNSEKIVRVFDEIVPTFQTIQCNYIWKGGKWAFAYKHEKKVTRDANGNVQSVIIAAFANEEESMDVEGFRVIYDNNGVATSILSYDLDYGTMQLYTSMSYDDIEWEECGQILNIEYMCLGDVRAKSYSISEEGEYFGNAEITYNDSGLFECTKVIKAADADISMTYKFTTLDENGSYEEMTYFEDNDEGNSDGEKLVEIYDQYGNMSEMSYSIYEDGQWEPVDGMMVDMTYDDGKLMEKVVSIIDAESGELSTVEKYVYGDYVQLGVTDIAAQSLVANYDAAGQIINIQSSGVPTYAIYSIDGRLVVSGVGATVSTSGIAHGVYVLFVSDNAAKATLKFVK